MKRTVLTVGAGRKARAELSARPNSGRGAVTRDRLTGLLNRESFFRTAKRMIMRHDPGYYVLSCFDVENFKAINAQYGTEKGDMVLKHIAFCINGLAPDDKGVSCRVTADRFAVLFPADMTNSHTVEDNHAAAMSPKCINSPIRIRIGRYLVDDPSLSVSDMYDRAMLAQESIRGRYDVYIADYREDMRENLLREQRIESDMDRALKDGEFEPWFQPQYNHATGAVIGAEALVRWKKDGATVSPGEFIPVFERNGFVYEVDKYVWRAVCALLRRWMDEGRKPLPVSVNISRFDMFRADFLDVLCGLVAEYGIPADMLRLEITESAFSEPGKTIINAVNELIKRGFTVEIDDFGSGYSSLNTLKDVPASILKLDMRFFENTENQQRSGNIIESVVRMAKWLGMAVIAEGVEDVSQADYLKSIGCYYIQGYYYAKPMPVGEYEKLMAGCGKEPALTRLETLKTLDNGEFWNPRSMETLIFNSYVGGACIFEFHNRKSELIRVNEQYTREMGGLISPGARLKDSSIVKFLDDENKKKLMDAIDEAVENKKEASREVRLSDGKITQYARVTVRLIARADDRFLFYCVVVNVTGQREAERKQIESAKRLEVIMSNVNGGVSAIIINDDGTSRLIFNNERYYELYGYTKEQALEEKLDVLTTIVAEDLPEVLKKVASLKQSGRPSIIDYRCIKRDGSLAYLRANASLMYMEGHGEVIAAVVTDISEMMETESQLEALAGSIPGGLATYSIDETGVRIKYFNDGFFSFSGCTREEYSKFVMKDPLSFVFEEDKPNIRGLIEGFTRNRVDGHVNGCVFRCHTKDGGYKWLSLKTVLTRTGDDKYTVYAVQIDITEQQEEKERLRVSEEINRLAIEQSGKIITRFDVKSRTLALPDSFNPIFVLPHVLYNMPEEQIALGRVSGDTAGVYRELFESIIRGEPYGKAAYKQLSSKGWRWLEARYTTVFSNLGKPVSAVISFTDVTEELEKEVVYDKWKQSLNERAWDSYTLFRCNLSKGDAIDSREGGLLSADSGGEGPFEGRTNEYAKKCVFAGDREKYRAFLNSDALLANYYRGRRNSVLEYREIGPDSRERWLRLTVDLVEYPSSKDIEAYLMYENIDEQKKADLLTLERSQTDPLTGILNRATFISKMEDALRASPPASVHALLMLDVDNFKRVNDTMGHGAGDKVLEELTSKISATLGAGDLLGRLGGDEFFVFLRDIGARSGARERARRICGIRVSTPDGTVRVTASVGAAMIPEDGDDFDTLYKKADDALYRRKQRGKNGFLFAGD